MKESEHIPVMVKEVLEGLQLKAGMTIIDATVGLGGHAKLILDGVGETGTLIAFDRDDRNLTLAKNRLKNSKGTKVFIRDSYANMGGYDLGSVDGILYDLGFSSVHVDDASRGFSFQKDGPLDMRYDITQELTAEKVVNGWSKEDLVTLFRRYAEESLAPQVVNAIFNARRKSRIVTTVQLADIISSVIRRKGRQHPATKIFQAIRIVVNDELGEVERGIQAGINQLKPGGSMVIITFHSQEDRLVKNLLKEAEELEIVTKKPLQPKYDEVRKNPRARSAKVRIAKKIKK